MVINIAVSLIHMDCVSTVIDYISSIHMENVNSENLNVWLTQMDSAQSVCLITSLIKEHAWQTWRDAKYKRVIITVYNAKVDTSLIMESASSPLND